MILSLNSMQPFWISCFSLCLFRAPTLSFRYFFRTFPGHFQWQSSQYDRQGLCQYTTMFLSVEDLRDMLSMAATMTFNYDHRIMQLYLQMYTTTFSHLNKLQYWFWHLTLSLSYFFLFKKKNNKKLKIGHQTPAFLKLMMRMIIKVRNISTQIYLYGLYSWSVTNQNWRLCLTDRLLWSERLLLNLQ